MKRITAVCVVLATVLAGVSLPQPALAGSSAGVASAAGAETTPESPPGEEADPDAIGPARSLVILAVGIVTVLALIIGLKLNAFLALIISAMVVSLLAPGPLGERISRVADAFGTSAGKIGIVIALAAVIGKCMLESGAADRIVRALLKVFGAGKAPIALAGSGFILSIPVFFDTVFYLLIPLARSLYRRTGTHYLMYILAITAGGAVTHALVPPTPGPLVMAATLDIDLGVMIMVGCLVALPAGIAGLLCAGLIDRWMPLPMREVGTGPGQPPLSDAQLPPLSMSLLPVLAPVALISANTILKTLVEQGRTSLQAAADISAVFGNANMALLISAVIAILMLRRQRGLSRAQLAAAVETALMSGGVIILITAAGGAFGEMLKQAQLGDALRTLAPSHGAGMTLQLLGFGVAVVLKVAQGSTTVAMITAAAMLAGIASPETLGFHPAYLATAIGGGALAGSWMNDSGFWIFAKMGGLTEIEALKSWTILLSCVGVAALLSSLFLALVLPLAG
jgi:GntP family gluconate:H+ symporter